MQLFRRFRDDRSALRRSAEFAGVLMQEPHAAEVSWLSEVATRGDDDHARWELRYLRRSLGVLQAQRDALDDRTASEALRALLHLMEKDPLVEGGLRELAARQFDARLSAYREAWLGRGHGSAATRVAQNLLAFSGGPIRADTPAVARGALLVDALSHEVGDALRQLYGVASLPDDIAPSAIAR